MSSGASRKKRLSLQDVVQKLSLGVLEKISEEIEVDEVKPLNDAPAIPAVQEKRRSSAHRLHLAKGFAVPSSPNPSESSAEDVPVSDKEIEEELPKESGPVEPMRCGVCGLRVYKSYRYISRSSAPVHLKIFFDPDTERFRVCKRCFSSKERCRQNLALLLLKSQTEQNVHLRSPLGITQGRRTSAMKYLFRDIGRSLKRPFEDLICDETFDEDYLSDGEENILPKATKKEPVSNKTFNNDVEKPVGTGVVTVVRPSSNTYQVFPNHFTIYGELGQGKTVDGDAKTEQNKDLTMIKTNNKKVEEKIADNVSENVLPSANSELKSEIQTINYKLTLLDHAYALPAAKTVKPYNKPPKSVLENVPNKTESLAKAAIKNMIKNNSIAKKTTTTSAENKGAQPATRTCGIICSMCKILVTKSYSCYRKENAPDKIKSYFTGDVKVMKVCRRCVPYKKPKGDAQPTKVVKNKAKILQAKIIKQKFKNAKKASKIEAKSAKNEMSTQTKDKTSQKVAHKEEAKPAKNVEKLKEPKKVESSVVVSPKKDATVVHVSIKNGKVESTSNSAVIKTIFPPIGNSINIEMKPDSSKPKLTNLNGGQKTDVLNTVGVETSTNAQPRRPPIMFLELKAPLLGKVLDKERASGNNGSSSVDFGTQPMHSMIGIKKAKSKIGKKDEDSEKKTERKQPKETPAKGVDVLKSSEDEKKVTVDGKQKENSGQSKSENEAPKEKDSLSTKDEEPKSISKPEQPADNQMDKGSARKLNLELSNSKPEGKVAKPASSKPFIEPVRSSPRRDRNVVPPEKAAKKENTESKSQPIAASAAAKRKKETEQTHPESTKQSDDKTKTKQEDEKASEKQTEDKAIEKVEVALKRSTRKGRGMKRKDSECSSIGESSSTTGSVDGDKKETKRSRSGEAKSTENDKKGEMQMSNHSYSTRWAQSPIKCGCCHENVVKSYRCVQLGTSPAHLKPVFAKESKNTLRICRKCLNFPSRVKSFL